MLTLGAGAAFRLDRDGQTVVLLTPAGELADAVTFGPQARDLSLGREPAGDWGIGVPTPGASNQMLSPGPASGLRINEWLASDASGPDWFEIHNSGPSPVVMSGLVLGNGITSTAIPALSFISASWVPTLRRGQGTDGRRRACGISSSVRLAKRFR